MQWKNQAGNLRNNKKVKVNFCPPKLSTTKIVTRKYHVEDCAEIRYDMILGRDLLT